MDLWCSTRLPSENAAPLRFMSPGLDSVKGDDLIQTSFLHNRIGKMREGKEEEYIYTLIHEVQGTAEWNVIPGAGSSTSKGSEAWIETRDTVA